MEECENCGCTIGKLETPYVVNDNVVCEECHNKINRPKKTTAVAALRQSRSPAREETNADDVVDWAQPGYAQPAQNIHPPQPQATFVNNVVVNAGGGRTVGGLGPAICSFIFPGLGQLIKGQPLNGIVWFFVTIIGYVCFIVPGLILHICCIVGAAQTKHVR